MSQSFVHISPLLADLACRHTVVTPNERLAREFKLAFDQYQVQLGKLAWPGLACMSLQRFLLQQLHHFEDHSDDPVPKLLSAHALRQAALQSAPIPSLNQVAAFCSAWQLIHRYDIDLQSPSFSTAQGELFQQWFADVQACLPADHLLPEKLGDYLRDHSMVPEMPLVLLDFEQFTAVERRYFDFVARSRSVLVAGSGEALVHAWPGSNLGDDLEKNMTGASVCIPQVAAYENLNDELAAAASWALEVKTRDATASIGIVVPNLAQNYARVQRQIATILDPAQGSLTQTFDLSAGLALSDQPVWRQACELLNACAEGFNPEVCAKIGNSQFFSLQGFTELAAHWPKNWHLNASLGDVLGVVKPDQDLDFEPSGLQTFAQWLEQCRSLLKVCGWPQSNHLGSTLFQAYQSLEDALDQYSLDSLSQTMSFTQMLRLLNASLGSQIFAPERPHADVLVLGQLETTGLSFSHLWVCGLDENSFPVKNVAHPFIPRSIAQMAGVPRASQSAELAFARGRLAHWRSHAGELVCSYSAQNQQHEQLPSPLISGFADLQSAPLVAEKIYQGSSAATVVLESFIDDVGPPIPQGEVKGGTGVLRAQATCPFKAFAQYRLGLSQPQEVSSFPDALTRGNLLHDTLFDLVRRHSTQEQLLTLQPADIRNACQQMLERYPRHLPSLFVAEEIQRLSLLILDWLKVEAARAPFTAVHLEETFLLNFHNYEFSIRVDRVDRIDGGLVVIDYKTGQVSLSGITSTPTRDPQLPAYSLIDPEIVGVYFAEIREHVRLAGVADEVGRIEGASYPRQTPQAQSWHDHRRRWQDDLGQLASDYATGCAVVDPLAGACRYCHLADFCRVEDQVEY